MHDASSSFGRTLSVEERYPERKKAKQTTAATRACGARAASARELLKKKREEKKQGHGNTKGTMVAKIR